MQDQNERYLGTKEAIREFDERRQTTSERYLPLWGMKPTVSDQCNLLDLHTLALTH